MPRILKGYKFRIYPTKEQEVFFVRSFGATRFIWNFMLGVKKEVYMHCGEKLNYYDTARGLKEIKGLDDLGWLKEVNSQSLQSTLRNLDTAYSRFFKKLSDFPVFKSKKDKQSFIVPQHFNYEDKLLQIPKLKSKIGVNQHREFGGNFKIKSLTISTNTAGKYFVSFLVEEDVIKDIAKTDKKIGIDLGLTSLMTFSDGYKIDNPKIAHKQRKKLEYQHRQFSKKKKGSKNAEKARLQLAKIYENITNKKQDFAHKLTKKIVDDNQVIVMEDLAIKSMIKNKRLARSIHEVSWYEIVRQLKYKSEWYGRQFIQVNQFFPSSKTCGDCNHINQDLGLSDRQWTCVKCESVLDRDVNAAKNILRQGLTNLSGLGTKSDVKQKRKEALGKVMAQAVRNTKSMICETKE